MNRNNGVKPTVYQGALKTPYPSPQTPKFASCDRLPPARTYRRTWVDFFEDLFKFLIHIGITIIVTDLVLQIIFYGFIEAPIARPNIFRSHYDTLDVEWWADQQRITKAWRRKESYLHPESVGNTNEAREAYYWVQLAYVELSDPLARCYHDQYHGYKARKFGKDDPCTKILTDLARDARKKEKSDATAGGREGILFTNATRDQAYGQWSHWRDVMTEKTQQYDEQGGLGKLATRLAAWPFVLIGFFFRLLKMLFKYFGELVERYQWR